MTQTPGPTPTTTTVSKYLGDCGFKRSRGNLFTGGFRVNSGATRGSVYVHWDEPLAVTERRMAESGVDSVIRLGPSEEEPEFIDAYMEALNSRYRVHAVDRTMIVVEQRPFAPQGGADIARLKGVRQLLRGSEVQFMAGIPENNRIGVAATQEWWGVRLLVRPWWGSAPWSDEDIKKANGTVLAAFHETPYRTAVRWVPEGLVVIVKS